jgi:hypothetical protein
MRIIDNPPWIRNTCRLTVSCPSCGKCADLAVLRRRYLEESKAG